MPVVLRREPCCSLLLESGIPTHRANFLSTNYLLRGIIKLKTGAETKTALLDYYCELVSRVSGIYLRNDVWVLKNRLGIKDSDLMDAAEARISCANIMLFCDRGFQDFFQHDGARCIIAFLARFMSRQEDSV